MGFIIFLIMIIIGVKIITRFGNSTKFKEILEKNGFANITEVFNKEVLTLITADNNGENYLFCLYTTITNCSLMDIEKTYEMSNKMHIHNVVIIPMMDIDEQSNVYKKIMEYHMDIWNQEKLTKLSHVKKQEISTNEETFLHTSDTSDDKCDIETQSYDPIQKPKKGILNKLFNKVERL